MTRWPPPDRAWWRAAATAALLLVSGGALGVLADRVWLSPPAAHAAPLTAEAMVSHLGLSPAEEARFRAVLDSLHAEVLTAVRQHPDTLRVAVRTAHERIEAALPPAARAKFRAWMQAQHDRLGRMHGGLTHEGGTHR